VEKKRIAELSSAAASAGGASDARIADAQKTLAALDAELAEIRDSVTPPDKMAARLRELLGTGRGLTVLGFRNLAPVAVSAEAPDRDGGAAPASGLYRHPMEIRLSGSYADLVEWIGRIERAPEGLRLSKVAFEAQAGQPIEARIEIFTLGTGRTWLTL
jgi:MSHA biogenesis protein MshJ